MRVRLTKCYQVDIVDDDGNVVDYPTYYGQILQATMIEYGTRNEALHAGKMFKEYVQECISLNKEE